MSMMSTPLYTKPLASGAVAVALDKYVLGQPDLKKSLYFGGSVAIGEAVSTLVTPAVPNLVPINLGNAVSGKTLTGRILEIALSTGSAWSLNKEYVLKNEINREDWTRRMAVIAASSFIGEYISDYLVGNPLSYFK